MGLPRVVALSLGVAYFGILGLDRVVEQVSGAWWTYPLILGSAAVDVVFPILPAETVMITAGVVASSGGLSAILLILSGAFGSFLGDNLSYALGRKVGEPAARRLFRSEKGRDRLEWARRTIEQHGRVMVLAARFIPGGRTAVTFASGTVGWSWREFVTADAPAAVVWATYVIMLGYLFGEIFTEKIWLSILVSLGVSAIIAGVGEVVRRRRSGRGGEGGDRDDGRGPDARRSQEGTSARAG